MTILSRTRCATAALTLTIALASAATAQRTTPAEQQATGNPALPTVQTYPIAASGEAGSVGGYSLSRWAEDWRSMRDPAKRDDPIDRLKFIPLNDTGDIYLTLSGEARLRVNMTSNPNLRETPHQRQDITRLVAGADLHLGSHFRLYGEVAHGGLGGRNLGTPAATLRNDLTFQQYFAEAATDVDGVALGARYGRQEFTDGPNLLVSQRDNNTIRYTLNGLRVWARGERFRVDAFDFRPTRYGVAGTGDDISDPTRRFSGVTFGAVVPRGWLGGSKLYFDPFLWRLTNTTQSWGGRVGRERRNYGGARLWGEAGRLTVDWTVNHQWGSFIDQPIDGWQGLFAQTYRLGAKATAPRVGFHADYASGGGGYGNGTLRNTYAPFGNNIYYSYQLSLSPSNLIAIAPNVTLSPLKKVRVIAEHEFVWRANATDAVYRANGQPFAGTQRIGERAVGNVSRLQVVWSPTPRFSMTGRYEHLAAGPSLTQAGYRSSDFIAAWASFRF